MQSRGGCSTRRRDLAYQRPSSLRDIDDFVAIARPLVPGRRPMRDSEPPTPLQNEVGRIGRRLGIAVIIIVIVAVATVFLTWMWSPGEAAGSERVVRPVLYGISGMDDMHAGISELDERGIGLRAVVV